jgi:hypothetical protein
MARSDKHVSPKTGSYGQDRKGYVRRDNAGQLGGGQQDGRQAGRCEPLKPTYGATNQQGGYSSMSKGRASFHTGHSSAKTLAISALSQLNKTSARASASFSSYKPAFSHEVFSSQAEYDASVDSVVARIKSGAVKARTPDE